jgi:hypothetical protein
MGGCSLGCDEQPLGELTVRKPLSQERRDFALAGR